MRRLTYQQGDQTYTVDLHPLGDDRYQAIIGDQTYTVQCQPQPDGSWRLVLEGKAYRVQAAAQGAQRFIAVDGQHTTLQRVEPRSRPRRAAAHQGGLDAPMPGQVSQVAVQEGDTVTAGQTLLILEAMKMEIRITAPAPSRVMRLLVLPGQVVERGQRLIELDAIPSAPESP